MEDRSIAVTNQSAPASLFDFGSNIDRAWKFAEILSKSAIIPDTFRGNTASCIIALDMAARMKRNPLEIMQAMYIVHGKPSFSSSFLISLINSCRYYEPLRFEFSGSSDEQSCIAWTVDKRTGDQIKGPRVSIKMAKEEGWYSKAGSKWKTMPEVMLRYRAASFFSRVYCPDLTGGFHSVEEAQETDKSEVFSGSMSSELEAEILASSKAPEGAPFDPAAVAKDESPQETKSHPAVFMTELEKLRDELKGILAIHFTDAEAEAWIRKYYGPQKTLNSLTKVELKDAASKINAELDAREL